MIKETLRRANLVDYSCREALQDVAYHGRFVIIVYIGFTTY